MEKEILGLEKTVRDNMVAVLKGISAPPEVGFNLHTIINALSSLEPIEEVKEK